MTGTDTPLSILALAPLPFLKNGVRTFAAGGPIFNAQLLPSLAQLGHRVRVIGDAPAAKDGAVRTGLQWDLPTLTVEWFVSEHTSSMSAPAPELRERNRRAIQPVFDRLVAEERPDVVLIGRDISPLFMLDRCRHHRLPAIVISHSVAATALARGLYPDAIARDLVGCFNEVEVVVAIAGHIEEMLRSVGVARVVTIRNVVDPDVFRPQPKDARLLNDLRLSSTQPIVGHVSALRPAKRSLDIMESAVSVLRSRPDIAYLIVGDGPSRSEMEGRAQQRGIRSSFRFLGEVAHEQVPRYLNLCDIVVLASEREGLPLITLETQACGRVMLSSDIPGSREIIVDGETGVLFRTAEVADLTAKTLALIGDHEWRKAIGQGARAVAETRRPADWIGAYVDVLRRAAARRFTGCPEILGAGVRTIKSSG
jgi:glycosyltransferase involved in cell wall biosynthesis